MSIGSDLERWLRGLKKHQKPHIFDGTPVDPARDYTIACLEGHHHECFGWLAPLVISPPRPCLCHYPLCGHFLKPMSFDEALRRTKEKGKGSGLA